MNLEVMSDHNICGSSVARAATLSATISSSQRRSEGGYTLVALLALMTVVALFAMAAAPRVSQQAQRERELEAIFRGEQVAEAIGQYYIYRSTGGGRPPGDQSLPASMEELLNGIPMLGAAKNKQILRRSAARDPLTLEGEWRFIAPRSQGLLEFQQSLLFYTGSFLPQTKGQLTQLQQFAVPPVGTVLKLGEKPESSSSSALDDVSSGPFVGVASRSRKDSVLTYYGIERHDQWIFTPLFRN